MYNSDEREQFLQKPLNNYNPQPALKGLNPPIFMDLHRATGWQFLLLCSLILMGIDRLYLYKKYKRILQE